MNDDYKLKARYTKILTAKDLANRFSSNTLFNSDYKALSTSTLYNLLETLVSNNYISYNYLQNVLPNHYSIENSSETEFILSDYPFTSSSTYFNSYGRYVTLESTSSVNLTMKKTSSDTNILDLEYPSNKTFILYAFRTKRYNANRDTEGTIFYYFTDEHNPIVDGKCIIISNNKSSGLSKAVGELPSSEDRTDSFLDPHANNLVYKSDLVTYDYNSIKVGDDLSNVRISLYDIDGNLDKTLHDLPYDSSSTVYSLFESTNGSKIIFKKESATLIKIYYKEAGVSHISGSCNIKLSDNGYALLSDMICPSDFIVKSLENVTSEYTKGIHKYFCLRSKSVKQTNMSENHVTYSRFNVNTDITNKDIVLVDSDGGLFKTLKGLNLGINNPKTLVENLDSSLGITVSKSENSDIIFNMKKGSVSTPMIRALLSDTGYTFDPNYPNVIKFTDKFVPNYISSSNTSLLDYLLIKNEKTLFLSDKENLSNKIKVLGGCDKDISNDYYIGAKDILDIMSGTYLDQDSNTTLLTENSIDFTTLSPGRYKFKASNPTDGYLRFVLYLKESTAGSLPYDSYISGRDIADSGMGVHIDANVVGNANTDRSEFTMYVTRSYSPDLPDGTLFAYILLDHSNITEPNQVLGFFKQTEGNYAQIAKWNNMYAETASLTELDQQSPSEYVLSDEDRKYSKITDIYDISFAKDTGWITCTTSSSNGVGTFNHSNAGGELQVRKVGKVVYLNLTLNLDLLEDTASNNQYLFILDKKYRPTQKIYFTPLLIWDLDSQFNSAASCTVSISPDGKVELLNYKEVARKQIEIGGNTLKLNHLVSYPV